LCVAWYPKTMTPKQLRMAAAATGMSLRELATETGLDASQISRIQTGRAGASHETMRRMELAFTKRGLRFEQREGEVGVFAPEPIDWETNQGEDTK
jgi:transcriptional regulator with XRE-family HTH domain